MKANSVISASKANNAALIDIAALLTRGDKQAVKEAYARMEAMLELSEAIQTTIFKLQEEHETFKREQLVFAKTVLSDIVQLPEVEDGA